MAISLCRARWIPLPFILQPINDKTAAVLPLATSDARSSTPCASSIRGYEYRR